MRRNLNAFSAIRWLTLGILFLVWLVSIYEQHHKIVSSSLWTKELSMVSEIPSDATQPDPARPVVQQQYASILITSNLIPSHPSIHILKETIASFWRYLKRLPATTPIVIAVDGLSERHRNEDNAHRLQQYIEAVREMAINSTGTRNIQVVASDRNLHLAGLINMSLPYIDTKYMYLIQHDFPFMKMVRHQPLLDSFELHPTKLRNVRFDSTKRHRPGLQHRCGIPDTNDTELKSYGLTFAFSNYWSDQNQFSTVDYYHEMFRLPTMLSRNLVTFPEDVMREVVHNNCTFWGQQLFGSFYSPNVRYIKHLDGKRTWTLDEETPPTR